jgi:murein DD-endopeptidase MepM/ murein hydrolase activator NlpD
MGNFVVIRHWDNLATIYGHLAQIYVTEGDFVRQGQVIGAVGKTGNANYRDIQPHLHFEVRKSGIPQDPIEYLE